MVTSRQSVFFFSQSDVVCYTLESDISIGPGSFAGSGQWEWWTGAVRLFECRVRWSVADGEEGGVDLHGGQDKEIVVPCEWCWAERPQHDCRMWSWSGIASYGCETWTLVCSGCGRTGTDVAVEEEDDWMGISWYWRHWLAVVRKAARSVVRCMFSKYVSTGFHVSIPSSVRSKIQSSSGREEKG